MYYMYYWPTWQMICITYPFVSPHTTRRRPWCLGFAVLKPIYNTIIITLFNHKLNHAWTTLSNRILCILYMCIYSVSSLTLSKMFTSVLGRLGGIDHFLRTLFNHPKNCINCVFLYFMAKIFLIQHKCFWKMPYPGGICIPTLKRHVFSNRSI